MKKITFLFLLGCIVCVTGIKAQLAAPIIGVTRYMIVNDGGYVLGSNGASSTTAGGTYTMLRVPSQEDPLALYDLESDGNGGYYLKNASEYGYMYCNSGTLAYTTTKPTTSAGVFKFVQIGTTNTFNIQTSEGYVGTTAAVKKYGVISSNVATTNNATVYYLIPYNSFSPVSGVAYKLVEHVGTAGYVLTSWNGVTKGACALTANTTPDNISWYFDKVSGTEQEYYVYNGSWGFDKRMGIEAKSDSPARDAVSSHDWTYVDFWTSCPTTDSYKKNLIRWQIFSSDANYKLLATQNPYSRTFKQLFGARTYAVGTWCYNNCPLIGSNGNQATKFDFVPMPISYTLGADYGTIVLPFNATIPTGLTVYTCSGVNNTTKELTLNAVTGTMQAYQPYIVMGTSGTTYTFNVATRATESKDAPYTDDAGYLVGNFKSATVPVSDASYTYYVLQNQDAGLAFYHVGSDITAGANRCYLKVPVSEAGAAKAFTFGNATGIATLKSSNASRVNVYSIDGRLVRRNVSKTDATNGLAKGVYVVGNQKVVAQ